MRTLDRIRRSDRARSGLDPNCVIVVGDGSRAERMARAIGARRAADETAWEEAIPRATCVIEAQGNERHEQLAALRRISAMAPDDAVLISTSPILARDEIVASITGPGRVVSVIPPWDESGAACEVVTDPELDDRTRLAAFELVDVAGWAPVVQRRGGPSLLTRLFGAVLIASWNLAVETGRPAEVDRAARASGLTWSPLRWLDRRTLRQVAGAFDRSGQIGGVESVYASPTACEPSSSFLANCGTDLIADAVPVGYFLVPVVEAAQRLLADGLVATHEQARRGLIAACGRSVAAEVSRAMRARYPD